jgi:hypothetical protein
MATSVGTLIYAQVDSANASTAYGTVLETHESMGGAYNNILGRCFQPSAQQRINRWTYNYLSLTVRPPASSDLPPRR